MQKVNILLITMLTGLGSILSAQSVSFTGKVTNQKNNEPVTGANVYFDGTTIGTATNGKGEFTIKKVKPGEYTLVISRIGYKRFQEEITIKKQDINKKITLKPSQKKLGQVVVTGTGTPHHLKNAPVQTEVIDEEMIDNIAPDNFANLMAGISPSFDFTPNLMGSFMQLNGLGNDYILLLIDGKRMHGDIGGQNDINRINPGNIERIEIVKGASSSLYGSDAIGGVVNVITKKSKNRFYMENNSQLMNNERWQQNNTVQFNLQNFSSSTSFSHKESKGWQLSPLEIDDGDTTETEKMAHYPNNDYTFSQDFTYSPAQNINIHLGGSKFLHSVNKPVSVGSYGYHYDDLSYNGGIEYLFNDDHSLQVDYHADRFKYYYHYNEEYRDYEKGDKKLNKEQLRRELQIKDVFHLNENHRFNTGAEYAYESLESAGRLENGDAQNVTTIAAYLQDEIQLTSAFDVVAGIRYVNHETFGQELTPKINLLYKLGDFNFRGSYARGFKAPTLKELYYHYERRGRLYVGNPDLDPQKSNYYSLSAEYINNFISCSITAYQNGVNNLIGYETVETAPEDTAAGISTTRMKTNISKAETKGIDFLFNLKLKAGISLGGGYSYVDARNLTEDIRLENVAHHYGNLRISHKKSWNQYQLTTSIISRIQDGKYYEEGLAKGYNIWNLNTIHRIKTYGAFNLEATAGINNIFDYVDDTPYGLHYGTITPGRTYNLGLRLTFTK